MEGAVIGTLDFMPPEQRQAVELIDHRSDLWSLAATFYQMLTGKSPRVINIAALPPQFQSVVAKALEESKENRFQSAREMRAEILQAYSGNMDTSHTLGEARAADLPVDSSDSDTTVASDFQQIASGKQVGIVREFWDFLRHNKKWWLTPIILSLLLIALIAITAGSGAAPFIYTLF